MSDRPLADPLPNILKLGTINLLAGASGIGKTAFLSWLIRQLELGAPVFGHPTTAPPAIGFLAADRSLEENSHWFRLSGVETLRKFSLVDDEIALPNQRMKHLRVDFFKQCVEKMDLPPGSLLIVDPIALFLGGNLLDYDSCAFACIEIQRWIRSPARRYCLTGVCHSAKQKADSNDRYLRLQDRISGTMAQLGYTSTQMFLAGPAETGEDESGLYTFMWNPHTAPEEVFQFPKGPNGLFLTDAAVCRTVILPGTDALTDADLKVLAALPVDGTPISTHQLLSTLTTTSIARSSVFRSLQILIKLGQAERLKHGLWRRVVTPLGESQAD